MQPFKPFASGGLMKPARLVRDERREWMGVLAGETYANETIVTPSGNWDDWAAQAAPGLTPLIRVTTPRPEPIHITFNAYAIETVGRIRFDYQRRFNAQCRDGTVGQWLRYEQGRFVIEWGAGKAKNFAMIDAAPGSFQIPIANWAQVWGWTSYYPLRVQAYAQIGYSMPATAYATYSYTDSAVGQSLIVVMPWARKITPMFYDQGVLGQGRVRVLSGNGIRLQEWLLRAPFTPNDQGLPIGSPISVPLVGDAYWIGLYIDAIDTLPVVSAIMEIGTG